MSEENKLTIIGALNKLRFDIQKWVSNNLKTKNVKLSEPFTLTKDFGYYTLGGKSSIQVGYKDQTLHEFLQGAFVKEDKTTFESGKLPSCTISITGTAQQEVGLTVTPGVNWNESAGEYKWGTIATLPGSKPNYTEKGSGITYTKSITSTEGPLDTEITYKDDGQSVTVTGTYTRSKVKLHPISNLGTDIYEKELDAKYKEPYTSATTASKTFTGYRKMFMFATSDTTVITPDSGSYIRSQCTTDGGIATQASDGEYKIAATSADKRIIWAIPDSYTCTLTFEFESSKDTWSTLTNAGISNPIKKVKIPGANGYESADYTVYICSDPNGDSFGGSGLSTRLKIS